MKTAGELLPAVNELLKGESRPIILGFDVEFDRMTSRTLVIQLSSGTFTAVIHTELISRMF